MKAERDHAVMGYLGRAELLNRTAKHELACHATNHVAA